MEMPPNKAVSLTSIYVSPGQSLSAPGVFWLWSTGHENNVAGQSGDFAFSLFCDLYQIKTVPVPEWTSS